jgi:nitrilase
MRPIEVAAVQMVSTPQVDENLAAAARLVEQAAGEGAHLVVLPEYFCLMGRQDTDKLRVCERDGSGPIQEFLSQCAARHRIWLVGGCVPLAAAIPGKVRSACLVYGPDGVRLARYDKVHLFSFERGEEHYREANTIEPGVQPVAVDLPFGRVGLSICYDLRFPELYRALGTCDVILAPSAFTATTGRAHWEMLLRARAVENQAFVIAPAQGGRHLNGRETHGHTMIVDPWGQIMAEISTGEGLVRARLEPHLLESVRSSLPALEHRVFHTGGRL